MSENNENEHSHDDGHDDGHHVNYFGIYIALVVLFLISVAGPEVGELTGLRWITLITAFGIAVVKANLVIQNFMHLKWEKNLMKWVLATSLILMFLMVAGISPDVMNHEGNNWENVAAKAAVERGVDGEAEEEAVVAAAPAGFTAESAFQGICATCHGAAGEGDGPAGAALDPPPANFADPEFWAERDRQRIIDVLENGAASVGGSTLMAAYGGLYTDEQIAELADYVISFAPEGAAPGGE
ncbi:MAG: c-type cytochrome [Gemmatimonadetes bacterium]|nr:c-type cytochrome [Gemmatimonadota bacterium]